MRGNDGRGCSSVNGFSGACVSRSKCSRALHYSLGSSSYGALSPSQTRGCQRPYQCLFIHHLNIPQVVGKSLCHRVCTFDGIKRYP